MESLLHAFLAFSIDTAKCEVILFSGSFAYDPFFPSLETGNIFSFQYSKISQQCVLIWAYFHLLHWIFSGPFQSVNSYPLAFGRFLEVFYWFFSPVFSLSGTVIIWMLDLLNCFSNFLIFSIFHLFVFYSPFWQMISVLSSNPSIEFFISAIIFLISRIPLYFGLFLFRLKILFFVLLKQYYHFFNISKGSAFDIFFPPA